MPRKSRWARNDDMWEWVAGQVKGGSSYSEIHGQLAVKMKDTFGLIRIPSVDTLRYQVNKRRLVEKETSPLPAQELESHYRALTYLGNALRYLIDQPPTPRPGMPSPPNAPDPADWRGFKQATIDRPEARHEEEVEVRDEWESNSNTPSAFSQYNFFRQHMDCTLIGRKVNNALDSVERTANDYMESFGSVLAINQEGESKKRKLLTAQENQRLSLTPAVQVRRMVQDGECELCSSKPLERAE